jgi:hypothetical protein
VARRVSTTRKQAIGEVVEWASGGAFKCGDIGCITKADTPKLRVATELMASVVGGAEDGRREPGAQLSYQRRI